MWNGDCSTSLADNAPLTQSSDPQKARNNINNDQCKLGVVYTNLISRHAHRQVKLQRSVVLNKKCGLPCHQPLHCHPLSFPSIPPPLSKRLLQTQAWFHCYNCTLNEKCALPCHQPLHRHPLSFPSIPPPAVPLPQLSLPIAMPVCSVTKGEKRKVTEAAKRNVFSMMMTQEAVPSLDTKQRFVSEAIANTKRSNFGEGA